MERKPLTIYFMMVEMPDRGWTRVGTYYRVKETAKGWRSFVKAAWGGLRTKVRPFKVTFDNDGKIDGRSKNILSEVFNCDAHLV